MAKYQTKKRFGQNFLVDTQIINQIINTIKAKPLDNMLEVGVGLGALTLPLLQVLKKLHIVEIDRNLVEHWQNLDKKNLEIHCYDILKFDLNTLASVDKPIRIVGNLPYNISSPILIKMLANKAIISNMCFMLQKEVVDRITAKHGSKIYGRLSVILQYYFEVDYLFNVPNTAFEPAPKVESSLVWLRPKLLKNELDYQSLSFVVKLAFSMRRKTLLNCLKSHINQTQTNIDLSRRAETLSVAEFTKLTQDYASKK